MEILRNWAFLPYYNDLSVEPMQLRVYKRRYAVIDSNALIEMMESSFDGVWITDGEGKVLFANSANASLLGVSKAELEGRTTQQLLDEKIFSNSVILEVIRQKKQISKISYNYHTRLTVLATATPIFDDVGNVKYVFNNVRDITALNELQNSLKSKDTIIQQQSRQLESMRIRLGEGTIIANSKAFNEVITLAQRVAAFDGATVLILGESGTGKEIISELIVNNSPRKDWPYLQVNCGAIPENLIESELFGYEKGAFTGADNKGHKGLFEAANGGTVFLDEIGDLPLHMQVKLLRVLQQKKVTRVGGTEPIALDVRVIAATNRNLEQMVREGTFREDLYYRLNVVSIFIPPLRERREDIIPLINHFLMVENQKYHTNKSIYSDTIDAFEGYCWPGNVRELENLLENLGHRFNNPKKIENVLEVLTGHNVQIEENIEKNKFQVFVMGYVRDLKPVTDFVDKVKPAHLSYKIKMSELIEADVWIYTGICLSEHEFYRIEVE